MLQSSKVHLSSPLNTGHLMLQVLIALCPGIAAMTYVFGYGVVINIMMAIICAMAMEAGILVVRQKPVISTLKDNSAIVSAVLLAISIPPISPWWIIIIGTLFTIVVAKHLYGGLGFNLFNPAMVGYAVLMISFPLQMTLWPNLDLPVFSLREAFHWQLFSQVPLTNSLDAITSATPLDIIRTAQRLNSNAISIEQAPVIQAHQWILNSMWVIGGCWLIYRRIAAWHLPVVFLGSFVLLTTLYWLSDTTNHTSPLFNLLHGSVIMAAFFIVTDPVTAPMTAKGKILAGVLVATLVFVIRTWGGYPEGTAFAVLLMNLCVPLIDRYL